jgi:FKBP-type peptidyl-prolyl cis-trans isomerase
MVRWIDNEMDGASMFVRVTVIVAAVVIIGGVVWAMVALNGNSESNSKTANASPAGSVVPSPSPSTSADGLITTDEVIGSGTAAQVGSSVTVKYTGTLDDGTVFDSTDKQGGQPATFTLAKGQLIDGWVEGIPGMKVGGKRKLVIPPSLGYGATVNGPIPANSTLTFEIELVGVK